MTPRNCRFWVSFHLADKWCSLFLANKEFLCKCNLGRNCKELRKKNNLQFTHTITDEKNTGHFKILARCCERIWRFSSQIHSPLTDFCITRVSHCFWENYKCNKIFNETLSHIFIIIIIIIINIITTVIIIIIIIISSSSSSSSSIR